MKTNKVQLAHLLYALAIVGAMVLATMLVMDNWGRLLKGGSLGVYYILGLRVLSLPVILLWLIAFLLNRNLRLTLIFWGLLGALFLFIFFYPVTF